MRKTILGWDEFLATYKVYWHDEPQWRKDVIKGNQLYYTSGQLPDCLPLPPEGFPSTVVDESFDATVAAKKRGTK